MFEPDDETLIGRVVAGQEAAFRLLARRHGKRGYTLAYRMLRHSADAEDVVQEALVRVWLNAHKWQKEKASFSTWFCRIVINLCIDRTRRRPMIPLDGQEVELAAPGGSAADMLSAAELEHEIGVALDRLPTRQRAALALCYLEEASCAEGAATLGISVAAMESLLVRGRRAVREHLRNVGLIAKEE